MSTSSSALSQSRSERSAASASPTIRSSRSCVWCAAPTSSPLRCRRASSPPPQLRSASWRTAPTSAPTCGKTASGFTSAFASSASSFAPMSQDEEAVRFDWRRGGAAAAGLVMALVLVVMVFAVKFANDARERALVAERQANQVALVVRNVSANVSKAEAALARFVLDEDVKTSGNIYASDWQLAGYQINVLKELEQSSP